MSDSDECDWTSCPGEVVPAEEAAPVVAAFEAPVEGIGTKRRQMVVAGWPGHSEGWSSTMLERIGEVNGVLPQLPAEATKHQP